MIVCRCGYAGPQPARFHHAIDPHAVVTHAGAGLFQVLARLGLVHQLEVSVGFHRVHECIGHRNADIEIGQLAGLVLGVHEFLHVGVIAPEYAHLRAAARARRLHGFAGTIEHAHVGNGAAGAGIGAAYMGAPGTDGGEVVSDAAAAAHGFGRFRQRGVDAGFVVDGFGDGIAHRLHETVDEGRAQIGAGGGIDAAGRNEAVNLRLVEGGGPEIRVLFARGQHLCHAPAYFLNAAFRALGILLQEHVQAHLLGRLYCGLGKFAVCVHCGIGQHIPALLTLLLQVKW